MYKNLKEFINKYKNYSKFSSLEEFNKNIEMFLAVHKSIFTKREFLLFRRLTKYGARVFGVATASIATILKAVEKYDGAIGVSESTFHRMRRKAVDEGILSVIKTTDVFGRQLANIWVFQKFVSPKKQNDTPGEAGFTEKTQIGEEFSSNSQVTPLKAVNNKASTKNNINKRYPVSTQGEGVIAKPSVKKKSRIPEAFENILSAFFESPHEIWEYWRMVQLYVRKSSLQMEKEEVLRLAVNSFQEMLKGLKQQRIKKPIAYFSWIFNQKLEVEITHEMHRKLERKEKENQFYLLTEVKAQTLRS